MKRNQPLWKSPSQTTSKLKLYNSLTRKKEIFVPQSGNKVLWYSCGITSSGLSHLGHARSYICFDVLRRVLENYFGYDVLYVMNITDIDDKIIKRARQNHFFEQYKKLNNNIVDVIAAVRKAMKHYELLLNTAKEKEKKNMYQKIMNRTTEALRNAEKSKMSNCNITKALTDLFDNSKDVLSEWLDVINGKEVSDYSIFSNLSKKYEKEFFHDMRNLNVLDPDVLTRVSEYIDEIIQFINKIIENGYAYESNKSVYFDTVKFNESPDHFYGKLVPEAFRDLNKLHEREGDLSTDSSKEKRNPSDFVLWKTSKSGEPSWTSPWSQGRPGWHIECSAMASDILGESLDIHTGGHDLKFPHHDNELAQAEAYFGKDHWVCYFLHSGKLNISGCKMSKSLHNFVTIKEALDHHSARQIRLAFLLHSWKNTLEYNLAVLENAIQYERLIKEFIYNVKDSFRNSIIDKSFKKMNPDARELHRIFQEKKSEVHEALCDNISTHVALNHLQVLIRHANKYMMNEKLNDQNLMGNILSYVLKILRTFGVYFEEEMLKRGNYDYEKQIMPILNIVADFRQKVRAEAKTLKAMKILSYCDQIRDHDLPQYGVRFEDKGGQKTVIKLENPEILSKLKKQREKFKAVAMFNKEISKEEQKEKSIPRIDYLKKKDKLLQFNDKGLPLTPHPCNK